MNKAQKKVIQAVILLITAFILLDPSVIGMLRGREFIFSINNIIAILVFVVAFVVLFSSRKK